MESKKAINFLDGYLTVEASFLIPMILFIYIFLVFTAFFLYNRCLLTQDSYLLSFRGSVFTHWSEGYGEIIYGYLPDRNMAEIQQNIQLRSTRLHKEEKYPAFQKEAEQIETDKAKITVTISGKTGIPFWKEKEIMIKVQAAVTNPIAIIREVRREN